jgi:hypothetical protein
MKRRLLVAEGTFHRYVNQYLELHEELDRVVHGGIRSQRLVRRRYTLA